MLFSTDILTKFVHLRNLNIVVHGSDLSVFTTLDYDKKTSFSIDFKQKGDIYYIDCPSCKKNMLIDLIDELTKSPNYYCEKIQKKVIFLLNLQNCNSITIQNIKSMVEGRFETACFLLHFKQYSDIDYTMKQKFLIFNVPLLDVYDDTVDIAYTRIINLVKEPFTNKTITEIRDICYMYYMNHETSLDLQRYIIDKLRDHLVLPNDIRYKIVKGIADINHKYRHSYRKPIFLETIIYCLFKHLENYNINHELL